ncbi:hypothetical protein JCM8097_003833 [Rhodosporidiobolus ruineniae]
MAQALWTPWLDNKMVPWHLPFEFWGALSAEANLTLVSSFLHRVQQNTDLTMLNGLDAFRQHLKMPPNFPLPLLQSWEGLLAPLLRERDALATKSDTFLALILIEDDQQCPRPGDDEAIDKSAVSKTELPWLLRGKKLEEVPSKHVSCEPDAPDGYLKVMTVVLHMPGEASDLCAGNRDGKCNPAEPEGEDLLDETPSKRHEQVWTGAINKLLGLLHQIRIALALNSNVHFAGAIANGIQATNVFRMTTRSRVSFKLKTSSPLLLGLAKPAQVVDQPSCCPTTSFKGHSTHSCRLSLNEITSRNYPYSFLLTQSISLLAEALSTIDGVRAILLVMLRNRTSVKLAGKVFRHGDEESEDFSAAIKVDYSLDALYTEFSATAQAKLSPPPPHLTSAELAFNLGCNRLDDLDRFELAEKMRAQSCYLRKHPFPEGNEVTTDSLAKYILTGQLDARTFLLFAIRQGYPKDELVDMVRSLRHLLGKFETSEAKQARSDANGEGQTSEAATATRSEDSVEALVEQQTQALPSRFGGSGGFL